MDTNTNTNTNNKGYEVMDGKDGSTLITLGDEVSRTLGDAMMYIDELDPLILMGLYSRSRDVILARARNVIRDTIDSTVVGVADIYFRQEMPEMEHELWFGSMDRSEVKVTVGYHDGNGNLKVVTIPLKWLIKDFDYKSDFEKYEPINRDHNMKVIKELMGLDGNDDGTDRT